MKNLRLTLLALTLVNLGLFAFQIVALRHAEAAAAPSVLRGKGIEIVDDQGRLRAQVKIEPANAHWTSRDGQSGSHPETVIFRLITPDGKPRVKLTTSEEGSGLTLLGESETTHTVLKADRALTSLRLRNDETTQKLLTP